MRPRRVPASRTAVGADRRRVIAIVLGHGGRLTAAGIAAGLLLTLLARPLLADLPVRVRPPDAAIVAIVDALLSTLALAACSVPARRAGRVDVVAVLKSD